MPILENCFSDIMMLIMLLNLSSITGCSLGSSEGCSGYFGCLLQEWRLEVCSLSVSCAGFFVLATNFFLSFLLQGCYRSCKGLMFSWHPGTSCEMKEMMVQERAKTNFWVHHGARDNPLLIFEIYFSPSAFLSLMNCIYFIHFLYYI